MTRRFGADGPGGGLVITHHGLARISGLFCTRLAALATPPTNARDQSVVLSS